MQLNIVLRGQSNAYYFTSYGDTAALKSAVEHYLGFDGVSNKVNIIADVAPIDSTTNAPVAGNYTIDSGTAFLSSGAAGAPWISPLSGDWHNGWASNPYETGLLSDL